MSSKGLGPVGVRELRPLAELEGAGMVDVLMGGFKSFDLSSVGLVENFGPLCELPSARLLFAPPLPRSGNRQITKTITNSAQALATQLKFRCRKVSLVGVTCRQIKPSAGRPRSPMRAAMGIKSL